MTSTIGVPIKLLHEAQVSVTKHPVPARAARENESRGERPRSSKESQQLTSFLPGPHRDYRAYKWLHLPRQAS